MKLESFALLAIGDSFLQHPFDVDLLIGVMHAVEQDVFVNDSGIVLSAGDIDEVGMFVAWSWA